MKEGFAQARTDLKESEARQREDMAELKANNRALGEKLDRLVEALATVKRPKKADHQAHAVIGGCWEGFRVCP